MFSHSPPFSTRSDPYSRAFAAAPRSTRSVGCSMRSRKTASSSRGTPSASRLVQQPDLFGVCVPPRQHGLGLSLLTPFRQPLRAGHTVVRAHCIQHTELRKWRRFRIRTRLITSLRVTLRCCCSSSHGSILLMMGPRFRWLERLGRAPSLGCSTSSSTRPSVSPMPAAI